MDCKSGSDSGIYISATVALMDIPNCRIVCKVKGHKMVKGFEDWAFRLMGNSNTIQISLAARTAGIAFTKMMIYLVSQLL